MSLSQRLLLFIAGLQGALAVATAAFASHGLEPLRGAHAVELWKTAAQMQGIHAVALPVTLLLSRLVLTGRGAARLAGVAALLFAVGATLFPGALYLLGWYGPGPMGAGAPLGGLSLILGWLCLGLAGLCAR